MSNAQIWSKPVTKTMRERQFRFNNRGEIIIIRAFGKYQIKERYGSSGKELTKYCRLLPFDPKRKIDVDLIEGKI